MGLKDWISSLFTRSGRRVIRLDDCELSSMQAEIYFKNLAINTAINLIGNAISQSEFITYDKGKKKRGDNYYLFNVEPNQNKSAKSFWSEVIARLVYDNEALIVQHNDKIYLAEDFVVKEYALYENIYKNVVIDNYRMLRSYEESEVLHLKLHDQRIQTIVDQIYQGYGELIEYSKKNYKRSNAKRGILTIPASFSQRPDHQEQLNKLVNTNFKKFYEAEGGAVLPLTSDMEYEDLSSATYKNGSDSRDIRYLIDDVFDMVAIAFQIPPQMLKGSVAESQGILDSFVTLCVNPMTKMIQDEINRKYFKKKSYLERTYLQIDTQKVRHMNPKALAETADILARIGVHNQDENREMLGKEPLGTKDSQKYYITKNYQDTSETSASQ